MNIWNEVHDKLEDHDYMSGVLRSVERVKATGEIFTPSILVVEMLKSLPRDSLSIGKKVIDPACGDGQFLVGAKWAKVLLFNVSEERALLDIFGIDIMRDNVEICRARLGGGTIVLGNALKPTERIVGQTDEEYEIMLKIFDESEQTTLF